MTEDEIHAWLAARLAAGAGVAPAEIDPDRPLVSYGLTSRAAIQLSGELERWLGRELSPLLAWEYPTTRELAHALAHPEEDPAL